MQRDHGRGQNSSVTDTNLAKKLSVILLKSLSFF